MVNEMKIITFVYFPQLICLFPITDSFTSNNWFILLIDLFTLLKTYRFETKYIFGYSNHIHVLIHPLCSELPVYQTAVYDGVLTHTSHVYNQQ